jgi:metallopeptidase MepB
MFSVFAQDPMNAKEGRRYRHMILEKGGSQDEMMMLEDFLGREVRTDAFYRELGLKAVGITAAWWNPLIL